MGRDLESKGCEEWPRSRGLFGPEQRRRSGHVMAAAVPSGRPRFPQGGRSRSSSHERRAALISALWAQRQGRGNSAELRQGRVGLDSS